jgi:hypothetical protein
MQQKSRQILSALLNYLPFVPLELFPLPLPEGFPVVLGRFGTFVLNEPLLGLLKALLLFVVVFIVYIFIDYTTKLSQ